MRGRRKYHNIPTYFQGERYDSRAEATRAAQLVLLQKAGRIHDWRRGKRLILLPKAGRQAAITYTPDFEVYPDLQSMWLEDVKGVKLDRRSGKAKVRATQMFRLKVKLFTARYPGVELRVVDKDGTVHETHCG
jgi:hypothetical protein